MSAIVDAVNSWSNAWLSLMGAILWQSTLLIGLVALIAWLLRRSSPAVRYWLWQIVAIKLLLMPFWTRAVGLPEWLHAAPADDIAAASQWPMPDPALREATPMPIAADSPTGPYEADTARPALATGPSLIGRITWQSWLFLGWLTVVGLLLIRLACQRAALGRLLREARPADRKLASLTGGLPGQLALRRSPSLLLTDARCGPFVCGLLRPVVVIPSALADSLEPGRLRQTLLHELAHVRRRDLLWGWPVEIARIVFFFHPVVYWVGWRLHLERELACDQQAMALSGRGPGDYAHTLFDVAFKGAVL